jgi:hypothetical protein
MEPPGPLIPVQFEASLPYVPGLVRDDYADLPHLLSRPRPRPQYRPRTPGASPVFCADPTAFHVLGVLPLADIQSNGFQRVRVRRTIDPNGLAAAFTYCLCWCKRRLERCTRSSRGKCRPEHGHAANGRFLRRFVFDDVPVLGKLAVLEAHDIHHDPVRRQTHACEPAV